MPSYRFPVDAGRRLTDATPKAITAELDRLGLPHEGVHISRQGDSVSLDGKVKDADVAERLVLAIGNLQGVGRVQDRLGHGHKPSLFDTLGAFAHLPAGAASTEAAETAVHAAKPEPETHFGPGGSLFHTVQPGETLAEIAARHDPGRDAEMRLLAANAPILPDAAALRPGMVVRIPPG